jgi:hypothetical protein
MSYTDEGMEVFFLTIYRSLGKLCNVNDATLLI